MEKRADSSSHRSHLPLHLGTKIRGTRNEAGSRRDADTPVALLTCDERRGKIPTEIAAKRLVTNRTTECVEAPTRAHYRADPRLEIPDPHLVSDVRRLWRRTPLVPRVNTHIATRRHANCRIFKGADQRLEGSGRHLYCGIDIYDDFAARGS